ncbi:MAG: AbrB/MazE/SpoVT family DNA-binding domain-containing protein [Blastocatellia bacterium]
MSAKLIEYLATARLGERGTMTLPKEYREALKLETGAPLTVLRIGDGLILLPEQKRFEQLCDSIAARLENSGVTEAGLQATLPEVREQLMRRRYPKLFAREKTRAAGKPKEAKRKAKARGSGKK